jgi:mRNA interferase RelE/StbE
MIFEIRYHHDVVAADIPKLSSKMKERIRVAIEQKLMMAPEQFGVPLRRSLRGYRKLRVGDYRIIFRIDGSIVKVFMIQHRSVVYKKMTVRL